ncbi:WD-40 repeat protein [Reticulomyxa filosa]|uniref:WD-40 repeat protein n=1 Tax=Reticulomyxa filosa TaxID=46433 RepID=X6LYB5_RETFI|nr:WD-40 repeat protein [Reticulomyxa filosa]|eukprot:ETO06619.1 WD-40 repeat protein [Reticulomyxa filosa]
MKILEILQIIDKISIFSNELFNISSFLNIRQKPKVHVYSFRGNINISYLKLTNITATFKCLFGVQHFNVTKHICAITLLTNIYHLNQLRMDMDEPIFQEEVKDKVNSQSHQHSCFNKNWILEQINLKKLIANRPMELDCPQHEQMDGSLIVGENCLKKFLKENDNSCPVQPHENCQFLKNKSLQRFIGDLTVMCLKQFEQESKTYHEFEKEGETPSMVKCNFKGKIKDLSEHLDKECPLKVSDCWFKPFGCNYICYKHNLNEHLISNMQLHFDLVVRLFQSMQQTIQMQQDNAKQLNMEIDMLKLEIQKHKQKGDEAPIMSRQYTTVMLEMNKLKNEIQNKMEEMKKTDNENKKIKKDVKSKLTQMKRMEKEFQQELLEFHSDFEIIKQNFENREKQLLSHYENVINTLEDENAQLSHQLSHYEQKEQQSDFTEVDSISSLVSTPTFDTFCSYKLLQTFSGHTKDVFSIDYSIFDDDQFLCSGSDDGTVRVWNLDTSKQVQIFKGHSDYVNCVKFSSYHYHNHHRKVICSSSDDKTIRFWDIKNNKQFQIFNGHTNGVCGIRFSPFNCGRYLCSGSWDNTICLKDIETFKALHIFNEHTNSVWCVEFSPLQTNNNDNSSIGVTGGNGYTICSGSWDKTIRIWDIETFKQLVVFKGHEDVVNSVKYSSCELGISGGANTILSGSGDTSVRLWDIRSSKQIQVFNGHTDWVRAVEYFPFVNNNAIGGNVICSGSEDNTIRFWDIRSNKELYVIEGDDENDDGICSLQFLSLKKKEKNNKNKADNSYNVSLCYGSHKGSIRIWG